MKLPSFSESPGSRPVLCLFFLSICLAGFIIGARMQPNAGRASRAAWTAGRSERDGPALSRSPFIQAREDRHAGNARPGTALAFLLLFSLWVSAIPATFLGRDVFSRTKRLFRAERIPLDRVKPHRYLVDFQGKGRQAGYDADYEREPGRSDRILGIQGHCALALVRASDEGEFLEKVCLIIAVEGDYSLAWISLMDAGEKEAVHSAACAGPAREYLKTIDAETERGRGVPAQTVRTGKLSVSNDIRSEPDDASPWRAEALKRGLLSFVSLPLIADGRRLGILNLCSGEAEGFPEEDLGFLGDLADDLAFGIMFLRARVEGRQALEALRKSELYYRSLFQNMHEELLVVGPDLRIRDASKEHLPILGFDREELVGRTCCEIICGFNSLCKICSRVCPLQEVLEKGTPRLFRHEYTRADGERVYTDNLITGMKDEGGKRCGLIAAVREITNEIKLERSFRQSQKMEAIGTLAGGIAHDFNNILGIIMGYTEVTLLGIRDQERRENLNHVLQACSRAKDIIRQILAFSRVGEQDELKPVSLSVLLKETLKLIKVGLPPNIEIRQDFKTGPGEDMILADPSQIHQLIINLCTNAGYAMRNGGGTLGVKLFSPPAGDFSGDGGLQDGSALCLSVSDTGQGIDPSIAGRIFEPYFSTKGPGQGTGLGLAVVHGIVIHHGGKIRVASEPEKGTVFNIYLPRVEHAAPPETTEPALIQTGKETILFVDDEVHLAEIGKEMLEHLGYRVISRSSSEEALAAFREDPEMFDLVITDQTMPGKTGLELCGELLQIRPDIAIILCTGCSEAITPEKTKSAGIREFMMKPLGLNEFAGAIRRALSATQRGS